MERKKVHCVRRCSGGRNVRRAFSLHELLVAMVIGSMILTVLVALYNRTHKISAAIQRTFEAQRLPREILQRIAEDLDNITSVDEGLQITIENKFDNGFPAARMMIVNKIQDKEGKEEIYKRIFWQSNYDFDGAIDGMIIYRHHSGIVLEDKLLDEKKETWEQQLFVPLCEGVTYFQIEAWKRKNENSFTTWNRENEIPAAITVHISFAEPEKAADGSYVIYDEDIVSRTIVLDRTESIRFKLDPREDPNDVNDFDMSDAFDDEDSEENTDDSVPDPNVTDR